MSKIHDMFQALIGLRKLLFTVGGVLLISTGMLAATGIFLYTARFNGTNLADVYSSGFTYMAAMVGSYLAVNVANKWVGKWMKKKK